MAHLLGFASFKGGTGKTTLAYAMAERSFSAGLRTLLLDFDPQETACGIAFLREQPAWEVRRCQVSVAGAEELNNIADSGDYDFVVGDLPGSEGAALQRVLASMDLVLCPVAMGAPDLLVASNFAWIAKRMSLPAVFVGNNLPPGRRRRLELTQELEALELPVCSAFVQTRVAHLDAMSRGRAPANGRPAAPRPWNYRPCGNGSPEKWGLPLERQRRGLRLYDYRKTTSLSIPRAATGRREGNFRAFGCCHDSR